VAAFYEDFLTSKDDRRPAACSIPSLSPENRPTGGNSLLCINATMDVAICREVLSNLCEACSLLGIEADGVARWRRRCSTSLPAVPKSTTTGR
jgi:alpha-L-fucosidase 2